MPSISKLLYASLAGLSIANPTPYHTHEVGEDPVVVSENLWEKLVKYTKYANAGYQNPCPNPPNGATIHKYIAIHRTTTQAYIFRNDKDKEFVVSFPGTRGSEDQHLDAKYHLYPVRIEGMKKGDCKGCKAHHGFMTAWQSISHEVMKELKEVSHNHPHYNITLTGHSLGGAIASLATLSLRSAKYPIKATYTFGQPRTGNKAYADYQDKLNHVHHGSKGHFHRVTHANDGVPHVPQRSGGYHHHGTEYWERNTNTGAQSQKRTFRCFGQEPPNCSNSVNPPDTIDDAHGHYSNQNMGSPKVCQ